MKVILNKIIPLKGYIAITLYPFIFAREKLNKYAYNHECIHANQQKELLIVMFYVIYCLEYLIKLLITFNHNAAYTSISFEQEAYRNEYNLSYNDKRKHYIWIKYIFKLWK